MSRLLTVLNRAAWIVALIAIAVLVVIVRDYVGARAQIYSLHEMVASGQKSIDAATRRQTVRDSALKREIQEIEGLKRKIQTPAQAAAALPAALPQLPLPVTVSRSLAPVNEQNGGIMRSGKLSSQKASGSISADDDATSEESGAVLTVPAVDLKPLFDNLEDCREATATVTTLKQDLTDSNGQLSEMTVERDTAIRKASRNTRWGNFKRAAKWLAVGVGVGMALSHKL